MTTQETFPTFYNFEKVPTWLQVPKHSVSLVPFDVAESATITQDSVVNKIPSGVWASGAPILWNQGYKGQQAKVGVIDTGIDGSHPDLVGKVLFRRDYVKDGLAPGSFNLHGTHVSGTIAANGTKLNGVAPQATLIDYRVLDVDGSGSFENITQAIVDATKDGCNVINMSLGGTYDYEPLHTAIKNAVAAGVLVVCAAGNSGQNTINYPGYYPEVVSVGAVDFSFINGNIVQEPFSSTNIQVDVCSDGYQVYSTAPGGKYAVLSGTSMATPHVTGFAALIWSKILLSTGSMPSESELYFALKVLTVDVYSKGKDNATGVGYVTAYPQLPKRSGTGSSWSIQNMSTGAPL